MCYDMNIELFHLSCAFEHPPPPRRAGPPRLCRLKGYSFRFVFCRNESDTYASSALHFQANEVRQCDAPSRSES